MKNKKGFTLIELLFVIAIITVVVTTTVVSYMSINNKQKQKDYNAMVANMKTAAEVYLTKNIVARQAINNQGHVSIEVEELVSEGLLTDYYTVDPITKESYVGFCIIGSQKSTDKINEFSNPIPCGSYLSMNTLEIEYRDLEDLGLDVLHTYIQVVDEKGTTLVERESNDTTAIEKRKNLINIYSIDGKKDSENLLLDYILEQTAGTYNVVYEYDNKFFERTVIVKSSSYCYISLNRNINTNSESVVQLNENNKRIYIEYGSSFNILNLANPDDRVGWKFSGWSDSKNKEAIEAIECQNKNIGGEEIVLYAQWSADKTEYIVNFHKENYPELQTYALSETITVEEVTTDIPIPTLAELDNLKTSDNYNGFIVNNEKNQEEYNDMPRKITGGGTEEPILTFNMYYNRNKYNLTVTKGVNITSVTPNTTTEYYYGQSLSNVTAVAANGYSASWNPAIPSTMPYNNLALTVSGTANKYTLNLAKGTGVSSITATGCTAVTAGVKYTCTYGATVKVTAVAASGYTISSTLTGTNISNKTNNIAFTMPVPTSGTAVTLTASATANKYTLNIAKGTNSAGINAITATGCTTVTAGVKYTCTYGATVKVTAVAASGYTISSTLTGTNISNKTNNTAFTMPVPTSGTAVTLTVNATKNSYTLNITKGTNSAGINAITVTGCTAVTAGSKYTCTYGATVKVTATAKSGYTINSALVGTNISNKTNGTAFTMPVPTSGTAVTLKVNATATMWTCRSTSSPYYTGTGTTVSNACYSMCSEWWDDYGAYSECSMADPSVSGTTCNCRRYTSYTWGDGTYDPCGGNPCPTCGPRTTCTQG